MENTFLLEATKETHDQRKTKIACMNSEAGQLDTPLAHIYSYSGRFLLGLRAVLSFI
jgi:hypothetical protein